MSQHHAAHATDSDAIDHAAVRETTTPDGRPRHQNEQDQRAPVVAPEAGLVDMARPEPKVPEAALVAGPEVPLVKPPAPELPKEPQAANSDAIAAAKEEEKDVRVQAEEALAAYIHDGIGDDLRKGLQLDLLPVVGYGQTGIKLCFHGPHVTTKAPLLNDALVGHNNGLLTKHPVLSKFFHNVAEMPKLEVTTDGSNMYHVIIPMSVETYMATLTELAGKTVQSAVKPMAAPLAAPDAVQAATAPAAEVAASPHTMVQAPVAALEKAVAESQPEQGAAR